jgi:nitrogen PTS system EIIA component
MSYTSVFREYGVDKAVFSRLDAPDKLSAVRAMVRMLTAGKGFTRNDLESMTYGILGREMLGSTGAGMGVAAPHTRHPTLLHPLAGWFVADPPIDFESLDDEPVFLFFCLVSPQNQPGDHLLMLERCSALIKDDRLLLAAEIGIDTLKEYFECLYSSSDHASAVEAELAGIGVGLDDLAAEKARFKRVAAVGGWAHCQTEMVRVEALLEDLKARLSGVVAAAAKEGANRLAAMRGCISKWAAHAKRDHLWRAIRVAASDELISLDVQVNGSDVSIRTKVSANGQREHLHSILASLNGLDGYRTALFVDDAVISGDPATRALGRSVEAELAGIGVGLDDLACEGTFFRCRVAAGGWAQCQTEMVRVEALLEGLQARLLGVGAVAAEEGMNRLAAFRGCLKEWAARAKKNELMGVILQAAAGQLSSVDVEVNGPEVSIRAKATVSGQRELLRSMIASLSQLNGYHAEIFIE